MRPSPSLLGASRLPLTPKRGNKDYYKGTRQAYAPGGGHRTGPPGQFVVKGKAKYRVVDGQVRVFVGPGMAAIEATNLKPYATTARTTPTALPRLPSFGPNPTHPAQLAAGNSRAGQAAFSAAYAALPLEQRQALVQAQRRAWWGAMGRALAAPEDAEEERTRVIEDAVAEKEGKEA
ncbi:hypothetical protein Q8F55_007824 [Vanrija albida]|uniref:Uncharacterized protein n=1 Tax=Vanrija albida TaxID=181172 RepID=A0ABR3PUL0_9TREE